MAAIFSPVPFAEIEPAVRRHLGALPSAIDSFLEEHILASGHYRIDVAGEMAGFASIHGESLLTQFGLTDPYKRLGQEIFGQLRRLEQVRSAFVPTCDEFFLAHALDDYRHLVKQAYFFAAGPHVSRSPDDIWLRPATPEDVELIRTESGDFFDPIEPRIGAGGLFVISWHEQPVGFGILDPSALYDDVASIGMYTIQRFRNSGVGTATLTLLREECRRRGQRPVAGCWYENHPSKRTLERAGMFSSTRLLKFDF